MRVHIGLPAVAWISAYVSTAAAYKERGAAERCVPLGRFSRKGLTHES